MKKIFLILIVCLVLMVNGCQTNEPIGEENIKGFLFALYQVENISEYEEFLDMKNLEEYSVEKTAIYEPYCNQSAMEQIKTGGYYLKYVEQAYKEKNLFFVKDIILEKDRQYDKQYFYTVKVEKRMDNDQAILETGGGIVLLDDEGYVDRFKITSQLKK